MYKKSYQNPTQRSQRLRITRWSGWSILFHSI